MPGLDGLALLREGRKLRPEARWIVITAHGSVESAVEAMKAGATDYLLKPFKSPDELRLVVRRALREAESETRITLLSEELGRDFPPLELIFLGAAMERLHADGARGRADDGDRPAHRRERHRQGGAGAGDPRLEPAPRAALRGGELRRARREPPRERALRPRARRVHRRRRRAQGAVRACRRRDAVPRRDRRDRAVRCRSSCCGCSQERDVERVGGSRPVPVDVRVDRGDQPRSQGAGRGGDVPRGPLLPAQRLPAAPARRWRSARTPSSRWPSTSARSSRRASASGSSASPRRRGEACAGYAWPGNIRELQNVMERAVILARGEIDAGAPEPGGRAPSAARGGAGSRRWSARRSSASCGRPRATGARRRRSSASRCARSSTASRSTVCREPLPCAAVSGSCASPPRSRWRRRRAVRAQEQEPEVTLPACGIRYPGGYDPNTVGVVEGRVASLTRRSGVPSRSVSRRAGKSTPSSPPPPGTGRSGRSASGTGTACG